MSDDSRLPTAIAGALVASRPGCDVFIRRLRDYNRPCLEEKRVGFYGLDIYSLSDCRTPWQKDPSVYGRAILSQRYCECESAVVAALTDLLSNRRTYAAKDDDRGTHAGTVAAHDWGEPMEVMEVRPLHRDSIERQFHDGGVGCGALLPGAITGRLREQLHAERLERFIGVIYRPETERRSHCANVELSGQFDAYVWSTARPLSRLAGKLLLGCSGYMAVGGLTTAQG